MIKLRHIAFLVATRSTNKTNHHHNCRRLLLAGNDFNQKRFINSSDTDNGANKNGDNASLPTIVQVRRNMMKLVGYDVTWGDKPPVDKSLLTNLIKKDQAELKKQRMKDSYAEVLIPLGDEPRLQNRYANFERAVRFGRLLEDLDTMAVHIAYLHNKSQTIEIDGHMLSPIVIVTALVDRIEINNKKIEANKNIKISGYTSWVGKSSCEVTMKLEQEISPKVWLHLSDAKFLVCARDANNKGSALMNPLEIVTDDEKAIFELGESKFIILKHLLFS